MIKKGLFLACILFASTSCTEQFENSENIGNSKKNEAVFRLYSAGFEDAVTRSGETVTQAVYDFLDYYIVDETGKVMTDIKSKYKPETAEIVAEGLHEGSYRLLVLGVKGEKENDGATVNKITNVNDVWLSFPEDLGKPLDCEYFYSNTPFDVTITESADGKQETILNGGTVTQHRIVGKVKFNFDFENIYVEYSVTQNVANAKTPRFYTSMTADKHFSGQSTTTLRELNLSNEREYLFMPTVEGQTMSGKIGMVSRTYTGGSLSQTYGFSGIKILPNQITTVNTDVDHPEDNRGTMFVSSAAYKHGNHKKILQDDEKKAVYTDMSQRSFNTSAPLQLSVTDEGQFHMRFYSPRDLGHITVKALIPEVSKEWFDFAYLDTIPAFGDAYLDVPMLKKPTVCKGESGRLINIQKLTAAQLKTAQFKIGSTEEFWKKIEKIKHGWTIYWGLYGGDPDRPDGGPVGNWMGIRPVHIRESIALFLNFTYMIDMPEHEQILRDNADKLYDDNKNPIQVERVLQQMRQQRTLQVGLVYAGNGVLGLGGGSSYGAYQQAWFEHYWNTYSCNIMFHELGHVMGYGHSSAFTYGPWAEKLMNNFYVNNLYQMPIDSRYYLNSSSNPNKY